MFVVVKFVIKENYAPPSPQPPRLGQDTDDGTLPMRALKYRWRDAWLLRPNIR